MFLQLCKIVILCEIPSTVSGKYHTFGLNVKMSKPNTHYLLTTLNIEVYCVKYNARVLLNRGNKCKKYSWP